MLTFHVENEWTGLQTVNLKEKEETQELMHELGKQREQR